MKQIDSEHLIKIEIVTEESLRKGILQEISRKKLAGIQNIPVLVLVILHPKYS